MNSNHILIKQFLDNEMSPEELASFEERLKTDMVLAEELAITKDLKKMLTSDKKNEKQTASLKSTLDKFGDQYFSENETSSEPHSISKKESKPIAKTSKLMPILAIAASIALLIFAGSYFMKSNKVSRETLAKNNFVQLHLEMRSATDGTKYTYLDSNSPNFLNDRIKEGNKSFANENYKSASEDFLAILKLKDNPKYDVRDINMEAVKFNLLMCQLALGPQDVVATQLDAFLKSDVSEIYKKKVLKIKEQLPK